MVDIYKIMVDVIEFESVLKTMELNMNKWPDVPVALKVLTHCIFSNERLNLFTTDMRILKTYLKHPSSTDVFLLKYNGIILVNRDIEKNKYIYFIDINHNKLKILKRKLILNNIMEN